MGCGCPERKERLIEWAERKGHERVARLIRKIPTPGGKEEPELQARRGWSVTDLPMSGRTSIGGPGQDKETDSPRRVLRGGTSRRE